MAKLTPSTYDQPPAVEPGSAPASYCLEHYRPELTGFCARMLRSAADGEDAVQETLMRAWRRLDSFEGRGSMRSWLYRIATNVCYDLVQSRQRQALPMDVADEAAVRLPTGPPSTETGRPQPAGRPQTSFSDTDPAEAAVTQESVRMAFVTALRRLPPRQRAVLILREVLGWRAREVAELLDSSTASVNSALQRARVTLAAHDLSGEGGAGEGGADDGDHELLTSYVSAFAAFDVDALVTLLRDDAAVAN